MTSAREKYARLFSPITIGTRRLKNRIAMPAVLPNYGAANRVTDRSVEYYAERAKGGVAMIVSEGLAIHPTSVPNPWVPTVFDPANAAGFARIAEAVERHDCRMLGQLWHVGRQQLWNPIIAPVGVSSLPDAYSWSVPHVMTKSDVAVIVEAFVQSARNLHRAGFSGVELHGGHGYLITQFLSPWSNVREDEYGGDVAGRTRFVREIIGGIRATCGRDFIVGLKMPGDERVKGGIDPAEAARIVGQLRADAPPDYLAFAQGNFSLSLEDHTPDMHYAAGPYLDLQREIRRAAEGIPVMAFGRIRDAAEAERALADGVGDFVGMGRVLVADPAFPVKVQSGRESSVRPCIFCQVCWAEIHAGKPMACVHNPELATTGEADWRPPPAAAKKRVTIVGAGVAGLEAAWIAAARGHTVTVLANGAPGGNARLEAALPGRGEVAKVYGFQLAQAAAHGVTIETVGRADVARITATRPDVVVLATGSRMRPPPTLAAGSDGGTSLRDYVAATVGTQPPRGRTAVLFDFDHTPATYAAADLLVERFAKVVLVTPRTALGRGVSYTGQLGVYRRLYAARVDIVLASAPVQFADGRLTIANAFNGDRTGIADVDLFTWATPRLADDALEAPLRAAGLDVRLVGDAFSPRTMLAAVHEGHAAGLAL
jgi:2,4-dienoyl-CoA reductase-like NADH-dependent reductase (Old Yellow Enzyme family)